MYSGGFRRHGRRRRCSVSRVQTPASICSTEAYHGVTTPARSAPSDSLASSKVDRESPKDPATVVGVSQRSDAPKRLAAPSDAAAPARPRRLPIPVPALALAGYVAVAFVVTAPVWGHPTMTWPGLPGDVYKFA